MLFKKKYGKFGLVILPANFSMHVISSFLVLLSLVFGIVFFFSLVLQGGNSILWVFQLQSSHHCYWATSYLEESSCTSFGLSLNIK